MMTTLLAILAVANPLIAVWFTSYWQNRKEKRDAKTRLFTALMAYRKSYVVSREWANGLNLIAVVFADCPKVVTQWHELYALFQNHSATHEQRLHKHLELLSEMAQELGYKSLSQTSIDKYYVPEVHVAADQLNAACQEEWYRVLKNTNHILLEPVDKPKAIPDAAIPMATPEVQRLLNVSVAEPKV